MAVKTENEWFSDSKIEGAFVFLPQKSAKDFNPYTPVLKQGAREGFFCVFTPSYPESSHNELFRNKMKLLSIRCFWRNELFLSKSFMTGL